MQLLGVSIRLMFGSRCKNVTALPSLYSLYLTS